MRIIQFFRSRTLWVNLAVMVFLTLILVFGGLYYLKVLSRYGETIEVPNFQGLVTGELDQYSAQEYFEFVVIDSVYDDSQERGSIVAQDPPPGSTVKKGRKVYLTVVSMLPEQVRMPDLEDLTLRQARAALHSIGLRVERLEYVSNIARNAVLRQEYMGREIAPGEYVEKGSGIKLVLGGGLRISNVDVPFLIGMRRSQAVKELHMSSLNVGRERHLNPADTAGARVYIQRPRPIRSTTLRMGSAVDLVYRSDRAFDFREYIREYKEDSLFIHEGDSLRHTINL